MQKVLTLFCAAALLVGSAQAQTRPAYKPAGKAAPRAARQTPQPATKPAALATAPVAAAVPVAPAPVQQAAPAVSVVRPASNQFGVGSSAVNLGIGFGLGYGSLLGGATTSTPALSVSYMRGLVQAGPGIISVGGLAGYQSVGWESSGDKATWRNIYVGGRSAYHYNFGNPRLDTYAGLGLGVRVVSYTSNFDAGLSASSSQAELSGFVGARYFFTSKLGAFSELGYDMSYLKVGLSARF